MKAFLLALLVAVLCVEQAHSLVCFTCTDASSNWGCLASTICPSDANYCVTTYIGAGIGGHSGQSISKGCSSVCPSVSYSVLAVAILASFVYIRAGL
ncbi:unnamed protein product [Eretmochelys imbricata]